MLVNLFCSGNRLFLRKTQRKASDWRELGTVIDATLTHAEFPWNHSSYVSDSVFPVDCEAPAMEILAKHDLYTAVSLSEAEKEHGPAPEERRVSRMWHIFFAKEGRGTVYDLSLNAEFFSQEDAGKLARSVHFTDGAWERRIARRRRSRRKMG